MECPLLFVRQNLTSLTKKEIIPLGLCHYNKFPVGAQSFVLALPKKRSPMQKQMPLHAQGHLNLTASRFQLLMLRSIGHGRSFERFDLSQLLIGNICTG